ncbi:MAG: hypothetical protein QOJ67_209 [Acidimicrobiaceae bacterium]
MLRLLWPENPRMVRQGELLGLSLMLENAGTETVEFTDAFLELFGRLQDEHGNEVATEGMRLARKLPRITYRLAPGDVESVEVRLTVSSEDQRLLSPGQYTVTVPLGDTRDDLANSVLIRSGADEPAPLVIEVQPRQPA